mgnify:CR=1 FL=1
MKEDVRGDDVEVIVRELGVLGQPIGKVHRHAHVDRPAARVAVAACLMAGLGVNALAILKHPNAYTIMFRDHVAPQLTGYGVGQGGILARTYVQHFRQERAPSELEIGRAHV